MKKLIFAALLLLSSQPCFALLSPLNQSLEEIQSIVQSNEIQKYLPQDEPIMTIHRAGNGYLLTTASLQMLVEIQYMPNERPGRQQFKFNFREPTSLMRGMPR
jgi:hypothetical protein